MFDLNCIVFYDEQDAMDMLYNIREYFETRDDFLYLDIVMEYLFDVDYDEVTMNSELGWFVEDLEEAEVICNHGKYQIKIADPHELIAV